MIAVFYFGMIGNRNSCRLIKMFTYSMNTGVASTYTLEKRLPFMMHANFFLRILSISVLSGNM